MVSNETRLKNVRRRVRRKPRGIVVMYEEEGVFYNDSELTDLVPEEILSQLTADEGVTMIIMVYEKEEGVNYAN